MGKNATHKCGSYCNAVTEVGRMEEEGHRGLQGNPVSWNVGFRVDSRTYT